MSVVGTGLDVVEAKDKNIRAIILMSVNILFSIRRRKRERANVTHRFDAANENGKHEHREHREHCTSSAHGTWLILTIWIPSCFYHSRTHWVNDDDDDNDKNRINTLLFGMYFIKKRKHTDTEAHITSESFIVACIVAFVGCYKCVRMRSMDDGYNGKYGRANEHHKIRLSK